MIGPRELHNLLNPIRENSNFGQEEPRMFRQLDALNLHCVAVLVYAAQSMHQRVADRFLRCIAYAVTLGSIPNLDKVPPAIQNLLLQAADIYRLRKAPAFPEFLGRDAETFGQFNPRPKQQVQFSNCMHRPSLSCRV